MPAQAMPRKWKLCEQGGRGRVAPESTAGLTREIGSVQGALPSSRGSRAVEGDMEGLDSAGSPVAGPQKSIETGTVGRVRDAGCDVVVGRGRMSRGGTGGTVASLT